MTDPRPDPLAQLLYDAIHFDLQTGDPVLDYAALDAAGYEVRPKSDRDEYAANMNRLVEQVDDCARELASRPKLTAERLAAALPAHMTGIYGPSEWRVPSGRARARLRFATEILAAMDDAP